MEITMTRKKRYIIVIRSMMFRREIAFWKMKESVLRKNLSLFLYTQNIFRVNWTGISIVCHKRWTCLHLRLNSMNLPLLMSNVSSNHYFFSVCNACNNLPLHKNSLNWTKWNWYDSFFLSLFIWALRKSIKIARNNHRSMT